MSLEGFYDSNLFHNNTQSNWKKKIDQQTKNENNNSNHNKNQ